MSRKTIPLVLVAAAAVSVLSALPAAAQTVAGFQGSTLAFSRNGDFNAERANGPSSSCNNGTRPTTFRWTFVEDGVIRFGNPVSHRFVSNFGAFTVRLDITCNNGTTASSTRFVCFSIGVGGCVFPDRGYN